MDRFHAITAFARVVESGSFARAAERLGVSVSSVSRQVAELEAHLDARLLNRTTRRLSLTESGQTFYERCVQLLADLEEAEVAVSAASVVPRGTLRLTCSATFGARHLAPAIAAFATRHPQVQLRRRALRAGRRSGRRRLRSRRARRSDRRPEPRRAQDRRRRASSAAPRPSYLERHGEPREPEDLATHVCLTYEYLPNRNVWRFAIARAASARSGSRARSTRTTGASSRRWRRKASASSREPDFIVGPDVRAGRLQPDPVRVRAAAACRSTSSIRAGGTCRRRCGRSPISWSSVSRPRTGDCLAPETMRRRGG